MALAACGGGGPAGPGDSGGKGGGAKGGSGGAAGATGGAAGNGTGGAGGSIGGSTAGSGGAAGAAGATGGSAGATGGNGGATAGAGGATAGTGGASGGTGGGGGATAGAGGATGGTGATAGTGGVAGSATAGTGGATAGTGGATGGTGGATGGTGGSAGAGGTGGAATACGNGVIDLGEQCDDHNRVVGDGCGFLCQIEADWRCPTPGSPCIFTALCGDGLLSVRETCDDGNTQSGDGCAADCNSVDPGYDCRVPGRACMPICGDGKRIGLEGCDDGNTTDGDGCSAICQVEPDATCTGATGGKSSCTKPACGNGVKEGNEGCDCGTSDTTFPAGCKGPNGTFFGDATGCSRTCTKEPSCRSAGGTTQACAAACGNGVIDMGEACDDGNSNPGDGCSPTCTIEPGFGCSATMSAGGEPCQSGSGQCLHLPAVIRDFMNESVSGGHPDFFYMGATVANPVTIAGVQGQSSTFSFSKRYCVADTGGPAKQNSSVNRSWDLAAATLGASGKPVFNTARANGTLTPCQFIDWSSDGNNGHVPGYTSASSPTVGLTYVAGPNGHPMYQGLAPIVTSADTFAQWFVDGTYTGGTHGVKTLELGAATSGQYQLTPDPHVVYGGFFPFDPPGQFPAAGGSNGPGAIRVVGQESLQCNIWPYWFSSAQFGATNNCRGDQYLFPPSVNGSLYPNGTWLMNVQGWFHDFWFTTEIRTTFVYTGAFKLDVAATDDFYAFINGKLVVDLGGTHQRLPAHVELSGATGSAAIVEGGRVDPTTGWAPACPSVDPYTGLTTNVATNPDGAGHQNCVTADCDCRARTADLGLQLGKTYELAMFAANRHCPEYNLDIGVSAPGNTSSCLPRCGDGLRTGNEQCDCGDGASLSSDPWCRGLSNDGSYGGCRTDCKLAGYCGDGILDAGTGEECDMGATNNTGSYGTGGCTPGCRMPHFCGDGILDAWAGEQCDRGTGNGTAGSPCSVICKIATP